MGNLFSGKCLSTARLDGVTAVITGSNTGIGKVTAEDFYKRGARVIMACRDVSKAEQAANEIRSACKLENENNEVEVNENQVKLGEIVVVPLDLSSLESVRNCAASLLRTESRLQLLINNAGIMACPKYQTADGFEMQFGVNHLGHYLLTALLLPRLIESAPSRIVTVSSVAHAHGGKIDFTDLNYEKRGYSAVGAYQQSKLANVLFTKELGARLKKTHPDVTAYCLHPGVIHTELGRHLGDTFFPGMLWVWRKIIGPWMAKTPLQGAQTTIYCAVDESCAKETGLYYSDCKPACPSSAGRDPETARKLWETSWKLVGLENDPLPVPTNN